MKRIHIVLFVAVVAAPLCQLSAQQKIGFVNASMIFEQYSGAKDAQQAYEKEMEDLNREVTEMEGAIRALADTLEARKFLFSEERLKEKRKELEKKQEEYLRFRQDAEMRAARRNDELSGPIIQAIEEAARSIAEKEDFDLVLDAGAGIVVYSKPELDLTDKVLQSLEEGRQTDE
jgi:outer membrane protein